MESETGVTRVEESSWRPSPKTWQTSATIEDLNDSNLADKCNNRRPVRDRDLADKCNNIGHTTATHSPDCKQQDADRCENSETRKQSTHMPQQMSTRSSMLAVDHTGDSPTLPRSYESGPVWPFIMPTPPPCRPYTCQVCLPKLSPQGAQPPHCEHPIYAILKLFPTHQTLSLEIFQNINISTISTPLQGPHVSILLSSAVCSLSNHRSIVAEIPPS